MDNERLNELSRYLVKDEVDCMNSFRHNLDMYLSEKDMTLNSLSEMANISVNTLSGILYRNGKNCNLITVIALAKALNVSIDELLGAGTIDEITLESMQICRNLPENAIYMIRWFIRHQERVNSNIPKGKHVISVMHPKCFGVSTFKPVNEFEQLDITDLPHDVKNKVFMGINFDCDYYMPTYSPYDILLIANDRLPKMNENCVIICGGSLYLAKRDTASGNARYFSIRDGKFRVNEDEIDELIGYIVCAIDDKNRILERM